MFKPNCTFLKGVIQLIDAINIPYGEHRSQFGVLRVPKESTPYPVVITIHGGFWQSKYDLDENNPFAEDLTSRGYTTWNIEYRRVGEDGGGWQGTFNDVINAVNHLSKLEERFNLDLSRVIVLGHSAGGHLALWLASQNNEIKEEMGNNFNKLIIPVRGVISLAGVTDLRNMWRIHEDKGIHSHVGSFVGGSPQEVPERYRLASPIELLPLNIEQILIHGELDRHVPVDLSKNYYQKAIELGDKASLVVLPEVEHFKIIDPSSTAWQSVVNSLETLIMATSRSKK
jgi:acetyl esterase/lipase